MEIEIHKLDTGYVVAEKNFRFVRSAHATLEDALTKVFRALEYSKGKEGYRVAILSPHETVCQVRPKPED